MNGIRPLLSQATHRWRRGFVLIVVAQAAASCSWFSSNKPRPPVEIKGPLVAMMIASSVDDKGRPVNPRFTFPPTEPQITAFVQLGKSPPSTLTVTWYQKSDDGGDKKLFEHQIQVKEYDLAFSTGKNPGPALLVGSYKVVATIGGETKELEFDIAPPKSSSDKTSSGLDDDRFDNQVQLEGNRHALSARSVSVGVPAASRYDQVSTEGLMRQVAFKESPQSGSPQANGSTAAGQPPVSGPKGTSTWPFSSANCTLKVGALSDPDTTADTVEVFYQGSCKRSGDLVQIFATVDGPPQRLGTGFARNQVDYAGIIYVDPCWLPGGSDLPGTKVKMEGRMGLPGDKRAESVTTLGDDTLAPRVHVVSTPARGSKVKTGDKIKLEVDATELHGGGPWQTGVKMIQVTALPGGQVGEPWVNSASPLSQKCTQKTWEQKYEATYVVPSNPPPIIKICALAEDYQGNEGNLCGDFVTGDKWQGTLHNEITSTFHVGSGGSCTGEAWDYDLSLVVGSGGTVQGKAVGHLVSMPQCSFALTGSQARNKSGDVSGKFDGRQFELQINITSTDGMTHGVDSLVNPPGQAPKLLVPITGPGIAQGDTVTTRTVATVVGSGRQKLTLKCADCK